ncbi:MAG TPA: MarR family transcriptional regulator [Phototrophicaceae bacterium]|nr:MarR family transcriptional regulator [Phototrophicaceae bacterium]
MPIIRDDDPEDFVTVDALVQLSFLIQSVLQRVAAEHELTIVQMRLLGILRDREPGMLELANYLGLDKSSVTGLIDRAEKHGLVARTPVPGDGRMFKVSVTPKGRAITEQVADQVDQEISKLVGKLNPNDRQRLIAIVARLLAS